MVIKAKCTVTDPAELVVYGSDRSLRKITSPEMEETATTTTTTAELVAEKDGVDSKNNSKSSSSTTKKKWSLRNSSKKSKRQSVIVAAALPEKKSVRFDLKKNKTRKIPIPDQPEIHERWYAAQDYAVFQYNIQQSIGSVLLDHDICAMWELLMECCQQTDSAMWWDNQERAAKLRQQVAEYYNSFDDSTGLEAWFHLLPVFEPSLWSSKTSHSQTTADNIRRIKEAMTAHANDNDLQEWYRSCSRQLSQPCRLFAREIALSLESSLAS